MKRNLLIAGALIVVLTMSCHDKEKEAQLQGRIDSLQAELQGKSSEVNEYFALINEIESNLKEIKERENLISLEQEKDPSDNSAAKKQIVEDIKAINDLMEENKAKLEELNQKLKNSNYRVAEFKKIVAGLEEKVTAKEEQVAMLNTQVEELTTKNETLNVKVDSLYTENTTKEQILEKQDSAINNMDEKLHMAYYTTGTMEELQNKEVIVKEGGILGIGAVEQLNAKMDKKDFTVVDVRKVNTIPVNSKKVELVTTHPEGSYELVMNEEDKQVDKLVILDADQFWKSSKYLVMVKK